MKCLLCTPGAEWTADVFCKPWFADRDVAILGYENSKITMDIYAKVKYNKPKQLHKLVKRVL